MSKLNDKHIELVESVNNARTRDDHCQASERLHGFYDALICLYGDVHVGHLIMAADMHYIDQGVERPMCGGVWLDWEPLEADHA